MAIIKQAFHDAMAVNKSAEALAEIGLAAKSYQADNVWPDWGQGNQAKFLLHRWMSAAKLALGDSFNPAAFDAVRADLRLGARSIGLVLNCSQFEQACNLRASAKAEVASKAADLAKAIGLDDI